MKSCTFIVHGPPVGKQRARTYQAGGKTRTVTPTKTRDYEATVGQLARLAWKGPPSSAPFRLSVVVVKPRPKRLCRKADPEGRVRCLATPDLDNAAKSVSDAVNGIVYRDDSQIAELVASKWYAAKGEGPRVEVHLEEIE